MYVDQIGRCHFYEYEKCHEMDLNLKNEIVKLKNEQAMWINVDDIFTCFGFVVVKFFIVVAE